MPKDREIGILKVYDPVKGFGFISREIGKDVFVFYQDFTADGDARAVPGATVEFSVKTGGKGPRAHGVTVVS